MKLSDLTLADLFALKEYFESIGGTQEIYGLNNKMITVACFNPRHDLIEQEIKRRIDNIEP